MALLQRLYDFVNSTKADAEQVDAEFNNIINYINDDIITQQPWQTATLLNDWANGSSTTVKFAKNSNGEVLITGIPTNTTGLHYGQAIFNLPAGYRPGQQIYISAIADYNDSLRHSVLMIIQTNGDVLAYPEGTGSKINWLTLNDIPPFRAEG